MADRISSGYKSIEAYRQKKFVLIDPSICNQGGHYLEYANRVLTAAKKLNLYTLLVVNNRSSKIEYNEADQIVAGFSHTFWENYSNKGSILFSYAFSGSRCNTFYKNAVKFANEIENILEKYTLNQGDIVFIPTVGAVELLGISLCSLKPRAASVHWHLLFRRDINIEYTFWDYHTRVELRRLLNVFNIFKKNVSKKNYQLYTDSSRLSKKYSDWVREEFQTLPVPVDEGVHFRKKSLDSPFLVFLPGDLRIEKGFLFLPDIIKDLVKLGITRNDIQFIIQSNAPSDIHLQAANFLRLIKTEFSTFVRILDGPLSHEEYMRTISESDLILLPYHAKEYTARSSGVFIEALAAGVPCVFPKGTWMEECLGGYEALMFDEVSEIAGKIISVRKHYTNLSDEFSEKAFEVRKAFSAMVIVEKILQCDNASS
jgi:glycosyltransferase involved in cell wall biosynthesis